MIETGLDGRVVIVTGGAAGIGRATALRFASEGARVAAWDLSSEAADQLIGEIEEKGGEGYFAPVDISQVDQVEAAVAELIDRWGQIDVLVNNAGILRDSQLVKWKEGEVVSTMTDEAFDAVIGVNLRGVFLCTRAVVPHMIRGGSGVVLNASSVVGLYGNFGQTNYAATKAGVINMTRSWARELGRYNIRVNAVAPGFVSTEILLGMPQKVLDGMIQHTPLRRMGTPEELAEVYLWLASDAASYVHGAVISADGGLVVGT
jgi:3-oxoacyl-[acyl-carrier protein] reductase